MGCCGELLLEGVSWAVKGAGGLELTLPHRLSPLVPASRSVGENQEPDSEYLPASVEKKHSSVIKSSPQRELIYSQAKYKLRGKVRSEVILDGG